ncbi:hypothetical protein AAG906_027002 [Vitis piasezkii]
MAKNRDKRKESSLSSASHTERRKQWEESILKLQHLKSLAMWVSKEASIPSLGAFLGHRLMTCGDPDPSLFPCQRCGTILQPGHNCTKSNASTQNIVTHWCHFCSHHNICPKVKPSSVSKHANPMPQKAANPEAVLQNEVEVGKTDEIASSTTAVDIITDSPATLPVRKGNTLESVSTSNKRRRKSWTSLREIPETSKQGNTQNIANLTIPFFL